MPELTVGIEIFWASVALFGSVVIGGPVGFVGGPVFIVGSVSRAWIVLFVCDLGF